MGFWTNYNPKVPRPGTKSTTPNKDGYVLPVDSYMGDFFHAIRSLMEASGNFVHVESHYSEGGRNANYVLIMGYGSSLPAPQQYMILVDDDSADNWGYTFDESVGSTSRETFCAAGRDTDHTPSPTSFKFLLDSTDAQGFCPNIDDSGGLGAIRYWSNYNSTQEIRVYMWSNTNWCTFLFYAADSHTYHDGNHIFFRLSEPADGHYTRATDGAVHGVLRVSSPTVADVRLAGVVGGYTSSSIIDGTLERFDDEDYVFPPTEDNNIILQKVQIGHSATISCHLGTLDGVYIGRYNSNLHYLDTVQIDSKEYICVYKGGERYTVFVQNEA